MSEEELLLLRKQTAENNLHQMELYARQVVSDYMKANRSANGK